MAEGQVYAQVDASVVNGGIAPMAIDFRRSGTSSWPRLLLCVWLRWQYDDDDR